MAYFNGPLFNDPQKPDLTRTSTTSLSSMNPCPSRQDQTLTAGNIRTQVMQRHALEPCRETETDFLGKILQGSCSRGTQEAKIGSMLWCAG